MILQALDVQLTVSHWPSREHYGGPSRDEGVSNFDAFWRSKTWQTGRHWWMKAEGLVDDSVQMAGRLNLSVDCRIPFQQRHKFFSKFSDLRLILGQMIEDMRQSRRGSVTWRRSDND